MNLNLLVDWCFDNNVFTHVFYRIVIHHSTNEVTYDVITFFKTKKG